MKILFVCNFLTIILAAYSMYISITAFYLAKGRNKAGDEDYREFLKEKEKTSKQTLNVLVASYAFINCYTYYELCDTRAMMLVTILSGMTFFYGCYTYYRILKQKI